jgi:hypothetical protein
VSRSHTTNPYSPASSLLTPSAMATSVHATHWQVSAIQYTHPYVHGRTSHSLTPWNATDTTLVEAPRSNERPSIELKISSRGAKILNAVVADSAGRPLYTISGDESQTTLLSHRDSTKVATINWDRSSPRMVFRGKKFKCKEWLARVEPDTEYVLFLLRHASPL